MAPYMRTNADQGTGHRKGPQNSFRRFPVLESMDDAVERDSHADYVIPALAPLDVVLHGSELLFQFTQLWHTAQPRLAAISEDQPQSQTLGIFGAGEAMDSEIYTGGGRGIRSSPAHRFHVTC